MRGASPAGCRATRMTLTGGVNSSGSTPDIRFKMARLAAIMVQWRSMAAAGLGSCIDKIASIPSRAT